jgi:hypothetical protein
MLRNTKIILILKINMWLVHLIKEIIKRRVKIRIIFIRDHFKSQEYKIITKIMINHSIRDSIQRHQINMQKIKHWHMLVDHHLKIKNKQIILKDQDLLL